MSDYGFFKHVQLDRVLSALCSDNREVLGQIYSDYLPQHLKTQRKIAHVALDTTTKALRLQIVQCRHPRQKNILYDVLNYCATLHIAHIKTFY